MVRYKYGYDSFKRLTDVSFDEEASVRYHYTYGNNGEVAQVEDKVLGRTIRSEYDLANRPMRKTTTDASGEIYAAEVSYDSYNNLQSFKERKASKNVLLEKPFMRQLTNTTLRISRRKSHTAMAWRFSICMTDWDGSQNEA